MTNLCDSPVVGYDNFALFRLGCSQMSCIWKPELRLASQSCRLAPEPRRYRARVRFGLGDSNRS